MSLCEQVVVEIASTIPQNASNDLKVHAPTKGIHKENDEGNFFSSLFVFDLC